MSTQDLRILGVVPGNMIDKYGRARVHQVVSDFYGAVLRSERLARYFVGIDVHGLMQHQAAFLAAVMGGPKRQSGRDIASAHRGMGVDPGDFEEMIRLLRASLDKLGFDTEDIEVITDRYNEYQPAVVGDDTSDG